VLGWVAEAGGVLLTLWHARQVREATRRGESLISAQLHVPLLLGLAVVTVPALGFSGTQLLWVIPLCYVVGVPLVALLSVIPGIGALVRLLTNAVGALCCAGLGRGWQDATAELSAAMGEETGGADPPSEE
jgi:hypothetical protein